MARDGEIDFENSQFLTTRLLPVMEERNVNAAELAQMIGLTVNSVNAILRKGNTSIYNLLRICKALEIDPMALLDDWRMYI